MTPETLRLLKAARDRRARARDDLIQLLLLIDSLNNEIDRLLDRRVMIDG